jgi:hypothetical protein
VLKPISALVPARSAEIDEECKRRFEAQKVRESHSLLAMMVPLQAFDTDKGSGSRRDLSVARPQNIRGWFYTGQWGLATSDTFPPGYYALVFRPVPGADGNPAIVSCGGFERKWGKSHSYGLYTPRARDGYTAIGDVYEHTDNPDEIQNGDFYGVVRNDLLIKSEWQGLLWNDQGSGARDDGSAFKFSNYDSRDTPDNQHMIQVPGGKPEARMFKTFGNYDDPPSGTPMKLDWSHIQVVSNNFIFEN